MTSLSAHDVAGDAWDLSFRVDLPLAPHAPALARRTVFDVLRSWQVTDDGWTYDVLLLASELVANAVRHGGRRVELALTLEGGGLLVEVSDGSSVVPMPRDDADESGRVLAIIAAIAPDWGVRGDGDGKTVWARMTGPVAAVCHRTAGDEAVSLPVV